MKITDLAIIFIIFTIPFTFILRIKGENLEYATYKKIEINRILDTAVEDGVSNLVTIGGDKKLIINKNKAVNTFFNSLFLNLNIISDELVQKKIKGYIPAIVIIDYDGFYVLSNEEYLNTDGYKEIKGTWKDKVPYSYTDGSYVFSFTLDDNINVYDLSNSTFYFGSYKDVKSNVSSRICEDNTLFEEVRRRTIVEALKREINMQINKHNDIARQFGITYNFTLPVIDNEDWYKSIDDIGMIVFFQGFPIGIGNERYNNFALGGARVVKPIKYFIQIDSTSNITYYHKENCDKLTEKNIVKYNQKECAKEGAIPCFLCKP